MTTTISKQATKKWSAAEIRRMPPEERDAILANAAEFALDDYVNDKQLTAFEAFGKEDLYGDSSNTCPR